MKVRFINSEKLLVTRAKSKTKNERVNGISSLQLVLLDILRDNVDDAKWSQRVKAAITIHGTAHALYLVLAARYGDET